MLPRSSPNGGARCISITMGSCGALLYENQQFQRLPAFPAVSIDTTGVGDAFNGALAASIADSQPLAQAATFASAFASLVVGCKGSLKIPER